MNRIWILCVVFVNLIYSVPVSVEHDPALIEEGSVAPDEAKEQKKEKKPADNQYKDLMATKGTPGGPCAAVGASRCDQCLALRFCGWRLKGDCKDGKCKKGAGCVQASLVEESEKAFLTNECTPNGKKGIIGLDSGTTPEFLNWDPHEKPIKNLLPTAKPSMTSKPKVIKAFAPQYHIKGSIEEGEAISKIKQLQWSPGSYLGSSKGGGAALQTEAAAAKPQAPLAAGYVQPEWNSEA